MGRAGVDHEPRLCITFIVGSYFAARRVAHIERLPGAFDVAYDSASHSTFFSSVFFSVPIFPRVAVGGCYISPLLQILPYLWVLYFHVGFFSELVGTCLKSLHI